MGAVDGTPPPPGTLIAIQSVALAGKLNDVHVLISCTAEQKRMNSKELQEGIGRRCLLVYGFSGLVGMCRLLTARMYQQ
jgi:hypothetical protein